MPSSVTQPQTGEASAGETPLEALKPDYSRQYRYEKTEKGKETHRRYHKSEKGKKALREAKKRWRRKTGKR